MDFCWKQYRSCRDVLAVADQCLHRVKAFSSSYTALPLSRLGVHMELGGTQRGQLTRDVPEHVMSRSEIKAGERRHSELAEFCLLKSQLQVIEPCFPRDSCEHLSADGKTVN